MAGKIIKEGGYQPTKDPPKNPPASAIKPANSGSSSGKPGSGKK